MTIKTEHLYLKLKIKQKKKQIISIVESVIEDPPNSEHEKQVLENFLLRQEIKLKELEMQLNNLKSKV